jgi:hypothetical protein
MAKLNDPQKRVWLEMMHLDQLKTDGSEPGCYAGAEILGERLHYSIQTVERARRKLKAKGFLVNKNRPGYRNDTWYPTLPIPLPPIATQHPSLEQIAAFRKQLDEANSGVSGDTSKGNSAISRDSTHLSPVTPPLREPSIRTEPRTEPTEVIQEEEVVGGEEKIRRDFATWKADFREVLGRDPTPEDGRWGPHLTGTEG